MNIPTRAAGLALLILGAASCSLFQGADDEPVTTVVSLTDATSANAVSASGSVELTVDLTEAKDVYFVFTNASLTGSAEEPVVTVDASVAASASSAAERSSVAEGDAAYVVKGAPGLAEANESIRASFSGAKPSSASRSLSTPSGFTVDEGGLGTVGSSTMSFYDYDSPAASVDATLRYSSGAVDTNQGQRALQVWVADDCWDGAGAKSFELTQAMVDAYAQKFLVSATGNDIYDWVTDILGAEWGDTSSSSLIDFDGVINIVLFDIDDDDYSSSQSSWVLGYFYGRDNVTSYTYSNKMLCFAIDAVLLAMPSEDGTASGSGTWRLADSYWPNEMVSTLAHEFQHMISFYQNLNDTANDTWAEEMMAMAIEDIVADKILAAGPRGVAYDDYSEGDSGNVYGRLPFFNYYPDLSLVDWTLGPTQLSSTYRTLAGYSSAYSFGAWLMRQYGGTAILQSIEDQSSVSAAGVLAAVRSVSGSSSVTFARLLGTWGAAILLSGDSSQSAPYRYNSGSDGGSAGFISTASGTSYNLGDINLFNYCYTDKNNDTQVGPWINESAPTAYGSLYPASNAYYLAAEDLSGERTWSLDLPDGVYVTVVIK